MSKSTRRIAYETLYDITHDGAYANLALKNHLQGLDKQQADFIGALVYETLDNLIYIDYLLDFFVKGKVKSSLKTILRMGICQILFMNVPQNAACNESVQLSKEIGKGALSGFVNGVMRNFCRNLDNLPGLPKNDRERLSIKYSYPMYIVDEYIERFGVEKAENILSYRQKHSMTLRTVSPFTVPMLKSELDKRNIKYEDSEYFDNTLKLLNGIDLSNEPLFSEGKITVQSQSAMTVCKICNVKDGYYVLDACAAPGGKTAYISELMNNTGKIYAWELHEHRKQIMDKTLDRLGVKNAVTLCHDATKYYADFKEKFDVVLVDAPCSGLGVTGKSDVKYTKSSEIISEIAKIQKDILDCCSSYVKKGGTLIYSTCTISQRENEDVYKWFLEAHKDFIYDEIEKYLPDKMKSCAREGMIQLIPALNKTEGFFIARFIRK